MKVLKFGGTSVGTAKRMQALVDLINDGNPKIVVLSAMSGTTNHLVEIAASLFEHNNEKATALINQLENKYKEVIKELYKTVPCLNKAEELIKSHFDYLRMFTIDLFTVNEERTVLAQGELISTALFHYYLEEQNIDSVLLPALNFMRTDQNEEPDMKYIEMNCRTELAKYPNGKLFITQGYICRNSFGEIDNLKRGGSDYSATIIGAAVKAREIEIARCF